MTAEYQLSIIAMFYALTYVEYWPVENSLLHCTVQAGSDLSLEKLCNVCIKLSQPPERNGIQTIEPTSVS